MHDARRLVRWLVVAVLLALHSGAGVAMAIPAIAVATEEYKVYFYDTARTLLATLTFPPSGADAEFILEICWTARRTVWVSAYEHGSGSRNLLHEVDPLTGTILRTLDTGATRYGGADGHHLREHRPSGDLLATPNGGGALTRLSAVDGSVVQTYSVSPEQFDVNIAGTEIVYLDTTVLKHWDLVNDVATGTDVPVGGEPGWPTLLPDGSVVLDAGSRGPHDSEGPIARYSAAGAVQTTYVIPEALILLSVSSEGLMGVNVDLARSLVLGHFQVQESGNDVSYLLTWDLATGAFLSQTEVIDVPDSSAGNNAGQIVATFNLPIPVHVTNAPQAPCDPQAQVNNGGKGKSGCNVGGVGWVSQYGPGLPGFAGYGTVPQHDDPNDGETLTGKEGTGIEAWIELVHTDYPSGDKTTYRRAFEELADDPDVFESGRKPAGVLSIGDLEHGLGNEQGGFEAASGDIELSDTRDRLIRELSDDQDLDGDEVTVKVATDPGRAAGVTPRVLLRGIVQRPEIESGLRSRLSFVDALFSDFGPFGPDRKWPGWTFGDIGAGMPDLTADTKAQAIPILFGEKSDEGAKDPSTNVARSKGLIPFTFCGMFDLGDTAPAPAPGPGKTLEAVVAELQASVTAHTTEADWASIIGHADAIALEAMGTVPDTYTRLADVIGYGDLDALLSGGDTAPPARQLWGFLAGGLGAWYQYLGVYGSDLAGGDPEMKPDRVKLDLLARGDILVPGYIWPFETLTVSFVNEDGRVFDLTGIFVRGPLLDDHLKGVVTLACNAIGRVDTAGLPVMKAEDVKQYVLENDMFNQWSSGALASTGTYPQWNDGVPKVRSSSFAGRQAYLEAKLGAPGILFSWYVDTQQGTLDVVRAWNTATESKLGVNGHGQILDWGLDETADPSTWDRIDHVTDVFGQLTRTSGEERQNVVVGAADWDGDTDTYRLGPFTYSSTEGIRKYKGRRKPGDPVNVPMINDERVFRWLLQQRLARLEFGVTLLTASGRMGWLDRDVSVGVRFNSEDGTGPDGYVDHPFVITRRRTSLTSRLVTYTLWDVRGMVLATAYVNGLDRQFELTDDEDLAAILSDDDDVAALLIP